MRVFSIIAALAGALGLAGCAGDSKPAEVVLVTPEAEEPAAPDVCNPKRDPRWAVLPRHKAVTKSDLANNDGANGRAFDTLAGKRAGCWRELKARG